MKYIEDFRKNLKEEGWTGSTCLVALALIVIAFVIGLALGYSWGVPDYLK